jgi:hypothetical protein
MRVKMLDGRGSSQRGLGAGGSMVSGRSGSEEESEKGELRRLSSRSIEF